VGLTHLGCPSCGGALSIAEGQRIVTCRYCGGRNLALVPDAIPRLVIAPGIAADRARATAEQCLAGAAVPPLLRRRGRIQSLTLCYVPFYEFTAVRIGSFVLRNATPSLAKDGDDPPEPAESPEGVQEHLRGRRPDETRVVQHGVARVAPACDLATLGLERIPLERMRQEAARLALQPYDPLALQREATVFAPTVSAERFREASESRMTLASDRTGLIERRLTIVYYPVWLARYRYLGRLYDIALDGVTGAILRGRAPMDVRRAWAVTVAGLAVAGFCFGRPAHAFLAASGPGHRLGDAIGMALGLVLGGAVALGISLLGWCACRQGAELRLEPSPGEPPIEWPGGPGLLTALGGGVVGWLAGRKRESRP
jgi:hypothetical protein